MRIFFSVSVPHCGILLHAHCPSFADLGWVACYENMKLQTSNFGTVRVKQKLNWNGSKVNDTLFGVCEIILVVNLCRFLLEVVSVFVE